MTTQYTRNVLKLVVAQICQAIGWHSVNSTPLEYMVDLMQEYIFQLAKTSQQYAQVLGRTEANLDDLGLAFRQLNIDLHELSEYIKNVDPVPCAISVPKLPISRENHLNFLKPGSQEVVTRPVHVFEHLPPMHPENGEEKQPETKSDDVVESVSRDDSLELSEDDDSSDNNNIVTNPVVTNEENPTKTVPPIVFKRPGDPISFDAPVVKRAKTTENGRPLREIHSVIMTTSGYLSTAREGKLPEARTPHKERSQSPPAPSPPAPSTSPPSAVPSVDNSSIPPNPPEVVPPVTTPPKKTKKAKQKVLLSEDGKPENKENKKKKIPKETLFEPDQVNNVKVKKGSGGKESKAKTKLNNKVISPNLAGPSNAILTPPQGKIPGGSPKNLVKNPLHKVKNEKAFEMQNPSSFPMSDIKEEVVDKLPVEPDKQKLNIFKKISSKLKEDRDKDSLDSQQKLKNSCEILPSVISDNGERPVIVKQEDKKLFVQNSMVNSDPVKVSENSLPNMMSPGSDAYMYDMSPPRTPSTPKTPEINVPSVPTEQKKKKKDKSGKKKEGKIKMLKNAISPKKIRLLNESMGDPSVVPDRPKTPQGPDQPQFRDPGLPPSLPFPFFPPFPTAPGLIPPPMFPLLPRGVPGMMGAPRPAVMPPMLGQRFYRPRMEQPGRPGPAPQSFEPLLQPPSVYPTVKQQQPFPMEQKPKSRKSLDNDLMAPPAPVCVPEVPPSVVAPMLNSAAAVPAPFAPISAAVVPAPLLPPNLPLDDKPAKSEKGEKKNKEHKKEKKDKMKKKKEKKEKHKEKGEKLKEKKDKGEKKDKLERLKEKKEKKEKRKEKEAMKKAMEEKVMEAVPKITLKLGPAGDSPRPATPDSALTKKITIKPPKKPDDEIIIKREPTPELARIAALVTRPPKQKSTSKRAQEGLVEAYASGGAGLSSDASISLASSNSYVKKPIFKTLPQRDPSSPMSYFNNSHNYTAQQQERIKYCYTDQSGRTVWICPSCGKQDDGSPMIGCDDCDAWYHWVCVGIQVAPADNEDWYCRMCIAKKEEQYHDKKKKKRKKKSA